jgi:D-alanyl-D-alanine carboxypeptidase
MLDTRAAHGTPYGLGIVKVELPCGTAYGHEGSVPGYWTLAYTNRSGTGRCPSR